MIVFIFFFLSKKGRKRRKTQASDYTDITICSVKLWVDFRNVCKVIVFFFSSLVLVSINYLFIGFVVGFCFFFLFNLWSKLNVTIFMMKLYPKYLTLDTFSFDLFSLGFE